MAEVSGHTRIWGILADPISHVKTPQMINQVAAERGVDGVMIPFHVAPADLATLVKGLKGMKSLHGFVVTVPHKTAIVDLLDEVSENARLIGAVNTVRREADGRLVGEMLDGVGFVKGLTAGLPRIRILIIVRIFIFIIKMFGFMIYKICVI